MACSCAKSIAKRNSSDIFANDSKMKLYAVVYNINSAINSIHITQYSLFLSKLIFPFHLHLHVSIEICKYNS